IALDDSGCPDSKKIVFTTEELVDGGIKTPYYIIAFNNGETYWTYRINAVSGAILEKSEKTPFISLEKARAIALQDANLPDSEKYVFTREELSRNQGRPCWILECYTSKFEYVYKIDAKTGEIIYFDYHIDILKAKKIAIDDAGCDGKVTFTEEKLVSGGIKTPYYHFVFNDGRTQWTYRIDATLGIVLEKSKASLIKAS
ncbi:MAG: PepSY domain-containing protein, partial [Eubacteriales bacterium]|nr:PepSY domain-containing protein [Eubacteriales bacterium]